ncbi:MAG: Hsp20/alpha crystallin family protein [Bacillota bacterium]
MNDFLDKLREALSRLVDEESLSGSGTYRTGDAACTFGYSIRLGLRGEQSGPRRRAASQLLTRNNAPDCEIQDEGESLRILVHARHVGAGVSTQVQGNDLVVKSGETTLCRIPLPAPVRSDTLRWSVRHGVLEVRIQKSATGSCGAQDPTGPGGDSGGTEGQ